MDRKDLNKVVKREHHLMRSVEEVTRDITNATVFSKLDANIGLIFYESSWMKTPQNPLPSTLHLRNTNVSGYHLG